MSSCDLQDGNRLYPQDVEFEQIGAWWGLDGDFMMPWRGHGGAGGIAGLQQYSAHKERGHRQGLLVISRNGDAFDGVMAVFFRKAAFTLFVAGPAIMVVMVAVAMMMALDARVDVLAADAGEKRLDENTVSIPALMDVETEHRHQVDDGDNRSGYLGQQGPTHVLASILFTQI